MIRARIRTSRRRDDDFFQPQSDPDDAGDDRIAFFDLDDAIHQSDDLDENDLPQIEYAIVGADGDASDDPDSVLYSDANTRRTIPDPTRVACSSPILSWTVAPSSLTMVTTTTCGNRRS